MAWRKVTISSQGGAVRYWSRGHDHQQRLVLCSNGRLLLQTQPHRSWRMTTMTTADVARDPRWRENATSAASAAVTRTGRIARRAG